MTISALCISRRPVNFFKFWWDAELDDAKDNSINAHKLWVDLGKPRQGTAFLNMKAAKINYKRLINMKSLGISDSFSNDLADALLSKDQFSFWKIWNSKFNKRCMQTQLVDGCTASMAIANKFMSYFSNICEPNNVSVHNDHYDDFVNSYNNCSASHVPAQIEFELIEAAMSKLKFGKAAGFDNITTEHLVYAHPMLISCLHKLFNLLLSHCYVPSSFAKGVMIPLLKSNDLNVTSCDSYRGLTLSPVISKLFEHVLLIKLDNYL